MVQKGGRDSLVGQRHFPWRQLISVLKRTRFIPTELASVESCLTATRAAQPICRRLGLFGSPPSAANRKDPSGKGNPSADLVAIRQHATEASSVVKRTCVALLSPSDAVQLGKERQFRSREELWLRS